MAEVEDRQGDGGRTVFGRSGNLEINAEPLGGLLNTRGEQQVGANKEDLWRSRSHTEPADRSGDEGAAWKAHLSSNRLFAPDRFTDSDGVGHRQHKDLAVADLPVRPGPGNLTDRVDRAIEEVLVHGDFQHQLAKEVRFVLDAALHFRAATLAGIALRVANGHPLNTDASQGGLHRLEFRRLDDRDQ